MVFLMKLFETESIVRLTGEESGANMDCCSTENIFLGVSESLWSEGVSKIMMTKLKDDVIEGLYCGATNKKKLSELLLGLPSNNVTTV